VAEAPDEPTYCEFKEKLSYTTKKEKGELVKDVSSFANADLEALGGYGYVVFGVSGDGRVVSIGNIAGDSPSEARQIVNNNLDRPVEFEYITCEVDNKIGGKARVAALVVPDSRRRPHMASKDITERLHKRDKFWLRKGEVWVRKMGSEATSMSGLVISGKGLREHISLAGEGAQLNYAVRAANVPDTLRGVLILR